MQSRERARFARGRALQKVNTHETRWRANKTRTSFSTKMSLMGLAWPNSFQFLGCLASAIAFALCAVTKPAGVVEMRLIKMYQACGVGTMRVRANSGALSPYSAAPRRSPQPAARRSHRVRKRRRGAGRLRRRSLTLWTMSVAVCA